MIRAPRSFWGLAAYCALVAALLIGSSSGGSPSESEYEFRQRDLEARARLIEGAVVLTAVGGAELDEQGEEGMRANMQLLADEAAGLSRTEDTPHHLREQAAAIWLVLSPQPLDPRELDSMLPELSDRGPLGAWVAMAAVGEELEPDSLVALSDIAISAWLLSRIRAWAAAPGELLDPDSTHARNELPWLQSTASLAFVYIMSFLVGGVLVLVYVARGDRLTGGLSEEASPWVPAPWAGWTVFLAWFALSATLQLLLAGIVETIGLSSAVRSFLALGVQIGAGLFAVRLLGGFAMDPDRRTLGGVLADLRVGVEPFEGRVMPVIGWTMAGFACAVALVAGSALLQAFLPIERDLVSNPVLPDLVNPDSSLTRVFLFGAVIAGAPFFEEIVFRGCLYRQLRNRIGIRPAIVLTSALFAVGHFDLGSLLPLFALGCVLAVLTERSGGLLPAMLVHGLWNGGTILIATTLYGA